MFIDEKVLLKHLLDAETRTAQRAYFRAISRSQGKYKSWKLAKMGHPYSERRGGISVPYGDAGIINLQSGKFYSSWFVEKATYIGDSIMSMVSNTAPHADDLVKGIPGLTIPRPMFDNKFKSVMHYWRIRELTKGIKDAIQGFNNQS